MVGLLDQAKNLGMQFDTNGVRVDQGYKDTLSGLASKSGMTAEAYDRMINPTTAGARWGDAATTKQVTTTASTGTAAAPTIAMTSAPVQHTPRPAPEVNPNSLVENRMEGLLTRNSPLNKVSRTAAMQYGNSRNLLNSSITADAGVDALIKNSLNIATPDSKTYADSALVHNTYLDDLDKLQLQGDISAQLSAQEAGQKMDLEQFAQGEQTNRTLADLSQRTAGQTSDSLKTLATQYQNDMQQILTSPSFADETSRNNALAKLESNYRASANLISGISGLELEWTTP